MQKARKILKNGGRERLLATARDLFTRRGASNVGINDVTDAAGVARMTLYNNFPSKESLTLAVYKELSESTLRDIQAVDDAAKSEQSRVLSVFAFLDKRARADGYRGCPFIHASLQDADAEGSIFAVVHGYKLDLREHVFGILDERRANREDMADQLLLLLDGAVTEAYLKGVKRPARAAMRAAETLLAAPH